MTEAKQEMIGDDETKALTPETDEKEALDLDSSKVQFINANGGGTARVDIGDTNDNAFCGLTKDELMKYADDPYWVRVRWILLILFWVAWFGMLAAAIIIIVVAPKCPHRPDQEWFQKTAIAQIYPRSYKDTNGDGVGDLKGIEDKIDYIKENNVDAVWLNSIYKSDIDFGYGVVDHKMIDPAVGTMEQFDSLLSHIHRKEMKLVLDFIPNHTSKNHSWFQASRKGGDNNEYKDFYVWMQGDSTTIPSNWLNVYGEPAWTYDDERGEWYLHQFLSDQPDLNLRNAKVLEQLKDILKFWLDKGVDGFRVVDTPYLFETESLSQDEAAGERALTMYQPETYALIAEWRKMLDEYRVDNEGQDYKMLMVEDAADANINQTLSFYGADDKKGADMAVVRNLHALEQGISSKDVANLVNNWLYPEHDGRPRWAAWQLGSHDVSRVGSRLGGDDGYSSIANMVALLLPGTTLSYYGEEIGMIDGDIKPDQTRDVLATIAGLTGRDPQRTPMEWTNNAENAGFTDSSDPWLPVNSDFNKRNVAIQAGQGNTMSILQSFRAMSVLRREPSFQWGTYTDTQDASQKIYGFVRQAKGFPGFLVAANFDDVHGTADFHSSHPDVVPREGKIVASTLRPDSKEKFPINHTISLDAVYLEPGDGVVLTWDWEQAPPQIKDE